MSENGLVGPLVRSAHPSFWPRNLLVYAAPGAAGALSSGVGFSMRSRTRELGVRLALGATAGRLQRDVVGGLLPVLTVALVVGLVVSLLASRGLASVLYGVGPTDPIAVGGAFTVLALLYAISPDPRTATAGMIQGRYFIPMVPVLFVAIPGLGRLPRVWGPVAVTGFCVVVLAVATYTTASHYFIGTSPAN